MKIVVIGCTGQSGVIFVQQAVEKGHEVVGICRTPSKMKFTHENFSAVKASIFDAESMVPHFQGADVVVSMLGFWKPMDCCGAVEGYAKASEQIMLAMQKAEMNGKFMAMHSWWSDPSSRGCCQCSQWDCCPSGRCFMYWQAQCCVIPLSLRNAFNGMYQAELVMEEDRFSDIDFVVMKPPLLDHFGAGFSQEVSSKEIYAEEGKNSIGRGYPHMSRGDVARWFLDNLDNKDVSRKMLATRYAQNSCCA